MLKEICKNNIFNRVKSFDLNFMLYFYIINNSIMNETYADNKLIKKSTFAYSHKENKLLEIYSLSYKNNQYYIKYESYDGKNILRDFYIIRNKENINQLDQLVYYEITKELSEEEL